MRNLIKNLVLTGGILLILSSCSEQYRLKKTMSEFVKAEIQIPDDLECIYNRELTMINKDALKPYKLVVYYDSLDCSSCRISHLMDLYPLYEMADTCEFSVMTIFSPKNEDLEEVKFQLSLANHQEHIYVDTYGTFSILNQCIPSDQRFHSFLLDDIGKPVFVGNPLVNTKLMEVFIKTLQTHNL